MGAFGVPVLGGGWLSAWVKGLWRGSKDRGEYQRFFFW